MSAHGSRCASSLALRVLLLDNETQHVLYKCDLSLRFSAGRSACQPRASATVLSSSDGLSCADRWSGCRLSGPPWLPGAGASPQLPPTRPFCPGVWLRMQLLERSGQISRAHYSQVLSAHTHTRTQTQAAPCMCTQAQQLLGMQVHERRGAEFTGE